MKQVNRTLWGVVAVMAYFIRTIGNMRYDYQKLKGNDNPDIYYISDAIMEVLLVYCIYRLTRSANEYVSALQNLFLGMVVFFLLKISFFDRLRFDISEWYGYILGLVFVVIQYMRLWKKSKN